MNEKEVAGAPANTKTIKANGKAFEGLQFKIQLSALDCTGCGNCADTCPSKVKSLVMKPLETQTEEIARWDYFAKNVTYKDTLVQKDLAIKNTQFAQPLFEFSGACAGCGETPYIKLITQLFGDRMMVANATGCSSIYGGSAPSTPYTTNAQGKGVAWANSLFEDNAEFGFGMAVASRQQRERIALIMKTNIDAVSAETKAAFTEWLDAFSDGEKSKVASEKVIAALKTEKNAAVADITKLEQHLVKKSQWIFGGDGWAYDIGFGGLDHVIASGEDINILVMDTEVYSNTGGQASKSTPVGAIAKFAASGKRVRKKDLGMIAMSYGYVYVAQVAMGSNQSQYLKAIREAEAYPGPSIIIAYAPCINHGIRHGMGKTQQQSKLAVECGYWSLYRFDPRLEEQGQNPFQFDSKEPNWAEFQNFIGSEVRFSSLKKAFPAEADELFAASEENAKWRYNSYQRLVAMNWAK
jgi:pyruvate-ferredoxin/flavodoxin oxidoreductase